MRSGEPVRLSAVEFGASGLRQYQETAKSIFVASNRLNSIKQSADLPDLHIQPNKQADRRFSQPSAIGKKSSC
jgi:hypothetical protein